MRLLRARKIGPQGLRVGRGAGVVPQGARGTPRQQQQVRSRVVLLEEFLNLGTRLERAAVHQLRIGQLVGRLGKIRTRGQGPPERRLGLLVAMRGEQAHADVVVGGLGGAGTGDWLPPAAFW